MKLAPLQRVTERSFYNPESVHGWATETLECGHVLQKWIHGAYTKGPPRPPPGRRRCDECKTASMASNQTTPEASMSRPERDIITELTDLLREANLKPYFNTFYMKPEQRVYAFRLRAKAYLTGCRASVRHFDPGPR